MLALIAAACDFGVRGENLEPPHGIAIGVAKIEVTDYVGNCLNLGSRNPAFS